MNPDAFMEVPADSSSAPAERPVVAAPAILRYVSEGGWLPGVPARDLTETDIAELVMTSEELVASGLYELVTAREGRNARNG